MVPEESCLPGEFSASQPAAHCGSHAGGFLPAQLYGKGLGVRGTHLQGAFVSAVPCEDEGGLPRGHGHHWSVDQAQLHDASIMGTQVGCVVQADP